ncbi:MAG: peptidase M22 [Opitutaceae bacterium]|nr:peptidase M22 [Opitutaceae bacterium]
MNRTLAQITRSGPVLLIDSASALVQTGLLRAGRPPLWETQTAEAGTAIFSCTEKLLARAALTLDDIAAFIFCDGPGSMLGIRTVAVALRAWRVVRGGRPVHSYCSLALVAHHLLATENARDLSLIADARRDTWHHVGIDAAGRVSALRRVPTAQLAGALVTPGHFRNWTPLPEGVRVTPYDIAAMLTPPAPASALAAAPTPADAPTLTGVPTLAAAPTPAGASALADAPLFAPAPEPDAFLHEEPVYQTWTPRVHQAG